MWQEGSGSVGESTNQIIGNAMAPYCSESIFPGLGYRIIKQKKNNSIKLKNGKQETRTIAGLLPFDYESITYLRRC